MTYTLPTGQEPYLSDLVLAAARKAVSGFEPMLGKSEQERLYRSTILGIFGDDNFLRGESGFELQWRDELTALRGNEVVKDRLKNWVQSSTDVPLKVLSARLLGFLSADFETIGLLGEMTRKQGESWDLLGVTLASEASRSLRRLASYDPGYIDMVDNLGRDIASNGVDSGGFVTGLRELRAFWATGEIAVAHDILWYQDEPTRQLVRLVFMDKRLMHVVNESELEEMQEAVEAFLSPGTVDQIRGLLMMSPSQRQQ